MKKKSFYFEDYTESEIINDSKNLGTIKISLNRVTFLFFIFFSLILIFSIKIVYLSLATEKSFYNNNTTKDFEKERDISEDQQHRAEERVQKLTNKHIAAVESAYQVKEQDLLSF